MRYPLLFCVATIAGVAIAEPPPLEKWTTADGKTAEAAFHSVDRQSGTVTILVPRTIELDRLDEESRDQAMKDRTPPPEPDVKNVIDRAETSAGGTSDQIDALAVGSIKMTLSEFLEATEAEKVASTGNVLYWIVVRGYLEDPIREEVVVSGGFNLWCRKLVTALEELAEEYPEILETEKTVAEVLYALLHDANLVRSHPITPKEFDFRDCKLTRTEDGDYALIGRIKSRYLTPIAMLSFNVEVHKNGQLVEIYHLLFSDIGPEGVKSFSMTISNFDYELNLSDLEMRVDTLLFAK